MQDKPKYIDFLGVTQEEMEAKEYVSAHDVRRKLKMSPTQFIGMLNGNQPQRLITNIDSWYRHTDEYGTDNYFIESMLDDLLIHYCDLERYLQARDMPALCTEESTTDDVETPAIESKTKGKNTGPASLEKLKGNLQSWKDAIPLSVSATIACIEAGKKKQSRTELKKLCAKKGIVFPVTEQFEAWRASLPGEYIKTSHSKTSQNTDENIVEEGNYSQES